MQIHTRASNLDDADFSSELDPLLQRIYQSRGINNQLALDRQLSCLPAPSLLSGMTEAVERLITALQQDQQIVIVGDFDVDGATSSALMMLALRAMGFQRLEFLVPNRFDYGYGLTPEIVDLATQHKPQLIVTVDNGISSIEGVAHAADLNIDVIVTDHHLPGKTLPEAWAIINPNQPGCVFPSKNLAGVGVAFYLLSGLRKTLRDIGWFTDNGMEEPNMAAWLDLVALGTVADVVPLDQVNRALVHQGLMRIRSGRCRPGIQALLRIAGKNPKRLVATDLGFAIGPRLNAAGRLDDISLGIQCLLTDDLNEAMQTAESLDQLNKDRRSIEQSMQKEAMMELDKLTLDSERLPSALCLFRPDWHQGVVGLVASRLKEKHHRPVVAFARADDGSLKGSSRSIPGLHIRDAMDAVATQNPGLISKFGGHAMAAGLTLEEKNLTWFVEAFQAHVEKVLNPEDLNAKIITDGNLISDQISMYTAENLREAGPWGQQFPEPCFEGTFLINQQRVVGENHLKLVLSHPSAPKLSIDAIYFNMDVEQWPNNKIQQARCVYRLDINEFRGQQKLQLLVQYMMPATSD
ncbi:MAG: single-stranded-DNA-specific exonuclease RecJ [Porticoccaceae bacterium]|jgi:single-stranded-DNA-specific exonuclease|nr:single-stranded-DNA-specific exonuclease RecJ [Porticoccaceae bacterium]